MAGPLNGKFTVTISSFAIVIAIVTGAANYGIVAATTDRNSKSIATEHKERVEADETLRLEWLLQVKGLNERIDRVLEMRHSRAGHGDN
jgi:hypothetical protein